VAASERDDPMTTTLPLAGVRVARGRAWSHTRRALTAWTFLGPGLALLVVFRVLPSVLALRESLYSFSFASQRREFVGLDNFRDLFGDDSFRSSLRATLVFNVVTNPLQTLLALALALLMNQKLRMIGLFRTIYLIPIAISLNVSAVVWLLMLDPNGLFNGILETLHVSQQPFLESQGQALWSIAAMASWAGVPLWAFFFLAGLQNEPSNLRDASRVDGASVVSHFRHVTLPLLKPVIAFVLVADTIANFLLFVPVFILTQGGPNDSTNLLMYDAYKRGLLFGDLGTSSAIVVVLLTVALSFVGIEFVLTRRSR
jgi:multiple sugar transport system permease protein